MESIKNLLRKRWSIPLLLLGVVLITYGYQISRMGLYWDDWEIVYLDHFKDARVYWDYFLYARPLTGWLYILISPLLGMNPISWQVLNILLRWAGLVGFWWTLRIVWPRKSLEIAWVCLLLAVYPAFTQHSVAVTYARHFACIALFTISLGLNLMALDHPNRWWMFTIPAALASILQLVTLEYFFGLELLRPIFLWIVLYRRNQNWKSTLNAVIIQWLPYIFVLIIFAGYRFVWYPMVSPNPEANAPVLFERLASNPLGEAIKFANLVLQDLVHLNVDNWFNPINPGSIELKAKANWLSWGAAAVIALFSGWIVFHFRNDTKEIQPGKDTFVREAIIIGLIGLLVGGIPVWITGRQSIGGPWADRFALGPMFGAVLLLVGIIHWFSREKLQQSILFGLIFGIALSSQMQTVNKYRLSWDNQNDFYWQLAWRAPAIKPGTAIVGPSLPFALVNDLHIGFALNAIYDQGGKSFEAPLWFFRAGGMLGDLIPAFKPGHTIDYHYLTAHFKGSTDQILVANYSYGTSCLRIATQEDQLRGGVGNDEGMLIKLSDPQLINPNPPVPAIPPSSIFGTEPEHGWCYSYQKMELARQQNDWQEAARLADEAAKKGQSPKNSLEYTPVILAYINTAQSDKALTASMAAQKMDGNQTEYFCSLWSQNQLSGKVTAGLMNQVKSALQCEPSVSTEAKK
ncbi:MAG TPA: hypothetical protein VF338_00330 [Leptolinea sp.]